MAKPSLLCVQNYSPPAVMPVPSFSLFLLSLGCPPKYYPEILFECTIFRKARFTFIRPLYIRNVLARAPGRFTFIYTNVYGNGIFQPIFRLAPLLFFFFYSHYSPLQKRVLYGLSNETPDRYRRVSCDNFFFPITAKRLLSHRQNIVANIFMQRKIVYFQRYALPSLLSRNIHSLLMDLSSSV